MSNIWLAPLLLCVTLELLILRYLIRSQNISRFRALFFYCVVLIVGVIALQIVGRMQGITPKSYAEVYWGLDVTEHAFVLTIVLNLIAQGLAAAANRLTIMRMLTVSVVIVTAACALVEYNPHLNRWMTPFSRDLSFFEEILNFALWYVLLRRKDIDVVLLLVSAGLGLQVTGQVIGHTLRLYSAGSNLAFPDTLVSVSEVLCLAIWAWTFRQRWLNEASRVGLQRSAALPQQ